MLWFRNFAAPENGRNANRWRDPRRQDDTTTTGRSLRRTRDGSRHAVRADGKRGTIASRGCRPPLEDQARGRAAVSSRRRAPPKASLGLVRAERGCRPPLEGTRGGAVVPSCRRASRRQAVWPCSGVGLSPAPWRRMRGRAVVSSRRRASRRQGVGACQRSRGCRPPLEDQARGRAVVSSRRRALPKASRWPVTAERGCRPPLEDEARGRAVVSSCRRASRRQAVGPCSGAGLSSAPWRPNERSCRRVVVSSCEPKAWRGGVSAELGLSSAP